LLFFLSSEIWIHCCFYFGFILGKSENATWQQWTPNVPGGPGPRRSHAAALAPSGSFGVPLNSNSALSVWIYGGDSGNGHVFK
jgi:hypothetical protein